MIMRARVNVRSTHPEVVSLSGLSQIVAGSPAAASPAADQQGDQRCDVK
jgi:hypothetical protein